MTIAYDGTDYAGWQIQPDRRTVQEEIETVICKLTGRPVRIHHSGRTDAGVHAKGQVAHVDLEKPVALRRFQNGLNALLPPAVRIMKFEKAAPDFHARFSATGKEYRYFIWNGPAVPPELRLYRLHERRKLNLAAMKQAAALLIGKHDFTSFTANPKREIGGTVKTVHRITVTRSREGDVKLCVEGEGFLYKMVRSIAGLLLRIGTGELTPADAARLLNEKKRTNEIPTAKPHGLFLWKVNYGVQAVTAGGHGSKEKFRKVPLRSLKKRPMKPPKARATRSGKLGEEIGGAFN
jgi:tRNA pseudouridine38-40 synthase